MKALKITKESVPLLLIFTVELFLNQWFVLIAILVAIIYMFYRNYNKGEMQLFVFGTILGFIIEVVMGLVARHQYWNETFLFGVPVWLPFIWGYGFVIIHRVGEILLGSRTSK